MCCPAQSPQRGQVTLWVYAQQRGIPASSSLGPQKCSQPGSVPKRPFDQVYPASSETQGCPQTRQTRGPHWHLLASVQVTLGLILFQPWHGHPTWVPGSGGIQAYWVPTLVPGHRVRRGRARLSKSPTLSGPGDLEVYVAPWLVGDSPYSEGPPSSHPR